MMGRGLAIVALIAALLPVTTARAADKCDVGEPSYSIAYLPFVAKSLGGPDGWVTPFIVQNTGALTTTIEINFYRISDGTLALCRRVSGLAPGTSYADIPNNDADIPGDTQFSAVVRSLGPGTIAVVVNEARGTGPKTQSASYVGVSRGSRRAYLPNVTRRFYGYDVPFVVQNVGNDLSSITATFTSFDGSEALPVSRLVWPGRSTIFDPESIDGLHDGMQYSVVVTSDQPAAVVANAHNEQVGPFAYAHNGLATGAPVAFAAYISKANRGSLTEIDSPVVIQNVSLYAIDVEMLFVPFGATDPAAAAQTFHLYNIPSLTARVFDPRFTITGKEPCYDAEPEICLGPGEYSLKLTATGDMAVVVLPSSAYTAAAYVASSWFTDTSRVFLPNVTRNLGGVYGWSTPVAVYSDAATNLVMRWYRFGDGALVKSDTRRFVPGTSIWIDPRSIPGLADDMQYSLDIRGEAGRFGAKLTALVVEQAAGGDSLMIYEGFEGY